jgi:hypothetical protein
MKTPEMPGTRLTKQDWILLLLREKPMDRIRLMKALFLIWHRSGRTLAGFYDFLPYMYGPCSFDLYRELENAQRLQLISQAPHPIDRWADYFLTLRGSRAAAAAVLKIDSKAWENIIRSVASEVTKVGFQELLRRVYEEAPDFAENSVVQRR